MSLEDNDNTTASDEHHHMCWPPVSAVGLNVDQVSLCQMTVSATFKETVEI